MPSIQYMSHEWYVREEKRLSQQLLNAERARMDVQRRNWMLVDYMAAKGVPLDEEKMRADFEQSEFSRILLENGELRLEEHRGNTAQLAHEAAQARGKVTDTELLDAVLKALNKSLAACKKKEMRAAEARELAAKSVASIPADAPREAA